MHTTIADLTNLLIETARALARVRDVEARAYASSALDSLRRWQEALEERERLEIRIRGILRRLRRLGRLDRQARRPSTRPGTERKSQ